MKRKLYSKLLEWKHESKGSTAIIIEGARRVGKSYIATEFAKNEYKSYILVDFSHLTPTEKDLFDNYINNTTELLRMMQLHYGVELFNRESCIIFDEVQQYPKARAAIKYLVADGRYDYIETGSLIRIKKNVKDIVIPSEEIAVSMYPMDFEEFLWALGDNLTMPYIKECYKTLKPLGTMHRKVMSQWLMYMTIGGMPQVVKTWVETGDYRKIELDKTAILNLYKNDIYQYATGAEAKAIAIWEDLPGQLQRHERFFCMKDLHKDARYRNYESAFFWLSDASVVNICWNTTSPDIGLRLNTDRTRLKCYLNDTGLLVSFAFDEKGVVPAEIYEKIRLGKLERNMGMIVENMVAQELRASGHKLYFYSTSEGEMADKRMEIDFLISKDKLTNSHNISPIEVKSGRNHYTTTSLLKFKKIYSSALHTAFVLHNKDLRVEDGITYLPLYMTSCL